MQLIITITSFYKKIKNQNSVHVMLKSGLPVLLLDSDTLIGSPIKPSSYAHVSIANLKVIRISTSH